LRNFLFNFYYLFLLIINKLTKDVIRIMGIGDWGLGIGDWGLGIGDWAE
jgi:hypothetical protein